MCQGDGLSSGKVEGIVIRSYYTRIRGENEYGVLIADSGEERRIVCKDIIIPGACIRAEGELSAELKLITHKVEVLGGESEKAAYEIITKKIGSTLAIPDKAAMLPDDLVMTALWPQLKEAAQGLAVADRLHRSVLLRFHGDADGICGAFALTSVLHCKAFQQNSAVYSVRDALRDISLIGQENRPFIILLDFGSSDPCNEGLELLRAANIQYIVIDHHPLGKKPPEKTISPFQVSEKASKYTAGYLACEIGCAIGLDRERAFELAKIACAGDKSDILPIVKEDVQKAMVLDYLASHVSFGNNLDFYKSVMANPELFASIAQQAEESIEEAAQKAMEGMKSNKTPKLETFIFSLGRVVKRGEWPPSSKVTTRIYDKIRNGPEGHGKAIICLGYTERSIIMRISDEAVALGFSANTLAQRMKDSMADFVDGGGGHVKAGAIKVKVGFVKEVLNELSREIEKETGAEINKKA